MYNRLELRVILIGDTGVGKKSMVRRFKMLNSSETKIFSTKEETNKNIKAENTINSNILITESQNKNDINEEIKNDMLKNENNLESNNNNKKDPKKKK